MFNATFLFYKYSDGLHCLLSCFHCWETHIVTTFRVTSMEHLHFYYIAPQSSSNAFHTFIFYIHICFYDFWHLLWCSNFNAIYTPDLCLKCLYWFYCRKFDKLGESVVHTTLKFHQHRLDGFTYLNIWQLLS